MRSFLIVAFLTCWAPVCLFPASALAATDPEVSAAEAARDLAPTGRLRVAINLGNVVLAMRDSASGEVKGVSVALAKALASRLELPLDITKYGVSGEVFDAMDQHAWDVAFLAIEPERAVKIIFSPPYLIIDGTYLVRQSSHQRRLEDVDRPGKKIAVARGAAYDLFLTRSLRNAELVRAPTADAALELFQNGAVDAVAGVRQALLQASKGRSDLLVLDQRFSTIQQAVAVPQGRPAGAAFVKNFVEEMKASGVVRDALIATGQDGGLVAGPAS